MQADPKADQSWLQAAYVVLTPAHNEAPHIPGLIESMLNQQVRPELWVIANDGSTDGTGDIARSYAKANPFIRVIDLPRPTGRQLSAKARAVAAAYEVAGQECPNARFVASIDADIEFPARTFAFLLEQFHLTPDLGVAGGIYLHPVGDSLERGRTSPNHVPGPLQMFRREVWDAIGGYRPMSAGGLDTVANAHARMLGWQTKAFDELEFSHNRRMGTGGDRHPVAAEFYGGRRDHSLGSALIFEVAKCLRRLPDSPMVIASMARLAGYLESAIRRRSSDVPDDIATFIKQEQLDRLLPQRWMPRRLQTRRAGP